MISIRRAFGTRDRSRLSDDADGRRPGTWYGRSSAIDAPPTCWYLIGMKSNTKSSITLPAEELRLVQSLKRRLKLRTNVEVVRRGLRALAESTERQSLKDAYRSASLAARSATVAEIAALDPLVDEGIE